MSLSGICSFSVYKDRALTSRARRKHVLLIRRTAADSSPIKTLGDNKREELKPTFVNFTFIGVLKQYEPH